MNPWTIYSKSEYETDQARGTQQVQSWQSHVRISNIKHIRQNKYVSNAIIFLKKILDTFTGMVCLLTHGSVFPFSPTAD